MNRRDFIKTSGMTLAAALGSAAVSPALLAQEQKPKRTLKKAIHLGMISGNMPVMDKFKLAKDMGFQGLEVNGPKDPDKAQILKARDETGIQIANVMDSVHWNDTLSDPKPEVRARGLEGLKEALRDAKDYGCPSVLLVPGVVNKNVAYQEVYERSQVEIRKALPLAEELGVKINIENVWNQFLLSPMEAARYVDEFNSKAVGWHFDAGNIVNYGWPEQWIRILNKRICSFHVKEFSRTKRDKEGLWKGFDVELLEGDNDWPAIMKALDEVGYQGWLIAEIGGGGAARLKTISTNMDRILAA